MASPQIEFDSADDVKAFAVAQLAGAGLPPGSIRAAALNLGFDQETIWPSVQPGSLGFMIPKFRWIIRNDDLKVLEAIADGFKAAAGVGFFIHTVSPAQLASAGAGILMALAKLVRQAKTKGAIVGEQEFRMLVLLHANGEGLTPAQIADVMSRSAPTTEDTVRHLLGALAKYAVADGSIVAFAAEDGSGRWHATGV